MDSTINALSKEPSIGRRGHGIASSTSRMDRDFQPRGAIEID